MGFQSDCKELLLDTDISLENIIQISINLEPVTNLIKSLSMQKAQAFDSLDPHNTNSLIAVQNKLEEQLIDLRAKLDEPNRKYQIYLHLLEEWEEKKKELLGEETFTDLLTYFQKKINDLDELPGLYKSKCKERIVLAKQIYQKIKHLGETYSKLYEPVQQFIQTHSIAKNKFVLNFDVSIVQSGFKEIFFDQIISHGVAGSFCGIDEGNKMLDELITLFKF